MSFRPLASAEWRNPPRWIMNHHKIKLATWEDSSTPFHFARNDRRFWFDCTNVNVPRFRPCGRVVVLRAANQNSLIAGGNHTIISSADCRRYSGCTIFWVISFTPTGYTSNGARPKGHRCSVNVSIKRQRGAQYVFIGLCLGEDPQPYGGTAGGGHGFRLV